MELPTLKSIKSVGEYNTDKNDGNHTFRGKTYLDVYDTMFPAIRDTPGNVLEIGVLFGGSLLLLKEYFGPSCTVTGIDIDPSRRKDLGNGIAVEIGSQADETFLSSVKEKHGPFKLVLDDGSHVVSHMLKSFECLWPSVVSGGIYIMEDLGVTYYGPDSGWPGMSHNKPEEMKCKERPLFDAFLLDLIRRMDHHKGDVRKVEFHCMIVAIHKV